MAAPLADRLRPKSLDKVVGQPHLIGEGKILRNIIESGNIPNMIFYGPSGVGKTTLAEIISARCGKRLHKLNATSASTSDIRDIIEETETLAGIDGILLYLDEIQYFNKKQQQSLLPYIENGTITLIASTTENPYFYVYSAVLSRCTVFEFKSVSVDEILSAVNNAFETMSNEIGKTIVERGAAETIAARSGGDVRKAINAVELCSLSAPISDGTRMVSKELAAEFSQRSGMSYDREGDEHYDILSAFQKSMRGSDPDAALHYLARLLIAGDLPSACRRLVICASEDVGLAYPQIIPIVKSAVDIALMVGLPEAKIPLADAVILVATSPKSNSAYLAINSAISDINEGKSGPIPRCLQNKHFDGDDTEKKGQFYKYPHNFPNSFVEQQYLPDKLKDAKYYNQADNKNENVSKKYWDKIKNC